MSNETIKTINKFNECLEHREDLTDDEIKFITYFNLELAKSIIEDLGRKDASSLARIILAALHISER